MRFDGARRWSARSGPSRAGRRRTPTGGPATRGGRRHPQPRPLVRAKGATRRFDPPPRRASTSRWWSSPRKWRGSWRWRGPATSRERRSARSSKSSGGMALLRRAGRTGAGEAKAATEATTRHFGGATRAPRRLRRIDRFGTASATSCSRRRRCSASPRRSIDRASPKVGDPRTRIPATRCSRSYPRAA